MVIANAAMVKPIYNKHDSVDVQLEGRHPYGNKKPKNDPTCKKLALKRYDQFLFKCWIPQFKTIWSFFVPTKISRNGAVPDRVLLPKKNSNFQFSGFFKCFYKNSNIFLNFMSKQTSNGNGWKVMTMGRNRWITALF